MFVPPFLGLSTRCHHERQPSHHAAEICLPRSPPLPPTLQSPPPLQGLTVRRHDQAATNTTQNGPGGELPPSPPPRVLYKGGGTHPVKPLFSTLQGPPPLTPSSRDRVLPPARALLGGSWALQGCPPGDRTYLVARDRLLGVDSADHARHPRMPFCGAQSPVNSVKRVDRSISPAPQCTPPARVCCAAGDAGWASQPFLSPCAALHAACSCVPSEL